MLMGLRRRAGAWTRRPTTASCSSPQGISADLIATIEGFSTKTSAPTRYAASKGRQWSGGYFAKSVVPVRDQNGLLITRS